MKILTVVGARPQFVKLAPVSAELRKYFEEVIVHTGQHYDDEMSNVFFEELGVPKPRYNLGIHSLSNAEQVFLMVPRLKEVISKEKPKLVIVYGDTNSTLAGAAAAKGLSVPVAHVEAGMRSFNDMPEEYNRVNTDKIADLFFCSTKASVENLKKEGHIKNVFLVGDVMIDSLAQNINKAESKSRILERLGLVRNGYMVATIHRAQNTDNAKRLQSIISSLAESGKKIILPAHPRTKKSALAFGIKLESPNLNVINPLGFYDMLVAEKNARKIITDSGGIQKEAYFFNVPCITLREVTEWTETVEEGFNVLVDADRNKITDAIANFEITGKNRHIYGNGGASKKTVMKIRKFLGC